MEHPEIPFPAGILSGDLVYRIMAPDGDDALMGCGISAKHDGEDGSREGRLHYSAVLCLRGAATFSCGGQRWDVHPGTVVMRFPGMPHGLSIRCGDTWAEAWIAFGIPLATAWEAHGIIARQQPVVVTRVAPSWVLELAGERSALRTAADRELPHHLMRLQSLLVQLLTQGAPPADGSAPGHGPLIEQACRRLMDDPRTDLARLAKQLGLSYERFRKVFREQTGMAPGEFRIRRRLERARALLQEGGMSVQDIAVELGYPNPYAFSAQFRKLVGTAPSVYRRGGRGSGAG
jgi:AraC-like DNA-binding protein